MRRRAVLGLTASFVMCLPLVACDEAPPNAGPAQATVFATAAIAAGGGTITFPPVGGYGASFVYSANSTPDAVKAYLMTTTVPVNGLPGPAPAGVVLVTFELKLAQNVTFERWYRLPSSVTIPASLAANGHAFSIYGYDLTSGVAMGSNPGELDGTSISFSPGLGPVTLTDHRYLYTLVMR